VFVDSIVLKNQRQRYEGCFTFGDVLKIGLIVALLLGCAKANAQPVCIKPERIPAIRQALGAPTESSVDRSGPWELSRPVALKYGLRLSGPMDERLDSTCAQYVSQQQWKDLFFLYHDSVLADIAVAVSPAFAVRTAKRWKSNPCLRELELQKIRDFEQGSQAVGKPGWSKELILKTHLSQTSGSVYTQSAPILTAQIQPTVPLVQVDTARAISSVPSAIVSPKPLPTPTAPKAIRYVVKSGDSFWKIARKFPSTSEAELIRSNKGKTTIYPGQVLWIPQ
jgi:LysM repeat protein